ncbi:MAG: tetratricopeptide repeat protein [Thiobacillus sp.]|uniref:tetratricopeptide repeat protein n=1 Tax=Thiobacillus sp. 63-78 TaxID=1895859 RepID=UPI001AD275EB|nr:tetratricopeptide repeat protein [Thiobacillus sp. 63-78]MBN8762966.1 tetratricopeptide repeat protein [Thiobacillus sp.]MBN8772746.1 tetratricopeptide repeat protein [Thiobacillus sp.]
MPVPHSPAMPPDLQQSMQMALEYRKGGRPDEAVALCRQVLIRYPQQPDVLGFLGELLLSQGDCQAALPVLEDARRIAPGNAQHWLVLTECLLALDRSSEAKKVISEAIGKGLRHPLADELLKQARSGKKKKPEKPVPLNEALRQIEALLQAGRYAEAEKLGQALRLRPGKSAQAAYLLGMAVLLQGRPEDAVPHLRRAVEHDGAMAPALYNLGFALERLERLDEALAAYRRTLAAAPNLADAHNNLGNVLQKLGRHDEALTAFEKAAALRPDAAVFQMNRGNVLCELERFEEGAAAYERALRLEPTLVDAYGKLALALPRLDRYEELVTLLQGAIEKWPDSFELHQSMGHALRHLARYEPAIEAYRRAIELSPTDAALHKDLGVALKDAGRHEAALDSLRRALEFQPDFDAAFSGAAGTLLDMGRHSEALACYREGLVRKPDAYYLHSALLLVLNYQADASPRALLAEARAFGEQAARKAVPFVQHDNVPDPDRRLRIGLVSGDLGQHPVGFFLQNVLASLDPSVVELFAYATAERRDVLNEHFHRSIPHWLEPSVTHKMSDEALARRIRADGIDILIDLAGHTAGNRLAMFAWKPAPVQVSWLGYLGTTGLAAMDYLLADPWALPAGEEDQFTETPWRLPETYICFSPPDLPVEVAPLPASNKGTVTFGCFNNLSKITDEVVACWSRVLWAVPEGRLFLKTRNLGVPEVREQLMARFARHGIGADRFVIEGQFPTHEAHFQAYNQVDIALDPFPYPGITTTMEALWMGVPVLALRGDRFISHQGETILHNAGLPEWIAADTDDYVAKAVAFARDTKTLAELRSGLRERLLVSPLCDAPRFARNLEAAFRGMWRKWCEQQQVPGEDG